MAPKTESNFVAIIRMDYYINSIIIHIDGSKKSVTCIFKRLTLL